MRTHCEWVGVAALLLGAGGCMVGPDYVEQAATVRASGLEVLVLNTDPLEAWPAAAERLAGLGWRGPSAFAPPATVEILDVMGAARAHGAEMGSAGAHRVDHVQVERHAGFRGNGREVKHGVR